MICLASRAKYNLWIEREQRERVIKYYNTAQPYYERFWYGKSLGLHYGLWIEGVSNRQEAIIKENEVLADLAEVKQGNSVLDAGCGVGGSGIWLSREREAKVVGFNIVNKQLAIGKNLARKRNLSQSLSFVRGDNQVLPFRSESFNVFWSLESIEHATNINQFTKEAFRVLKPGGRMVVAGTFKGRKDLSDEEKRQIQVGLSVAGCFTDFRTAKDVCNIGRNVGFVNVRNIDQTEAVMRSSREMTNMSRWGLPVAKELVALHAASPLLILNNEWGLYQEGLFKSGATSYNILVAEKPSNSAI